VTYVVLEGPDGCGKSSQAVALAAWLRDQGRGVVHVREPGSTPVGEALRQLLLATSTGELRPITEALLFSAARAELVANVIAPAVQRGDVVVAERCYLSTVVYQSLAVAGGLDVEQILDVTRAAHGAHLPDVIFVLDVDAEVARGRRRTRSADRIEARGDGYHDRVRAGFVRACELEVRARRIDATRSFDDVQADLRAQVAGWTA